MRHVLQSVTRVWSRALAPPRSERARRWSVAIALVAAAFLLLSPAARAEMLRFPIDQEEVDKMEAAKPHAAELLERGEALAAAGQLAQADALFVQGLSEYKLGSLLHRRHCEVLTAMGRRAEAVAECYRALQSSRSNPNIRATVRAGVSGPNAPSWADIELALDLVSKERERAPGQFTPIAALCDVAASLGDGIMLQHCANELLAIAPEAAETRRAMALLSARCPPWRFWLGWITIVAASLATLGHALWRWARRGSRRRRAGPNAALVGGVFCAALSALPASARAEDAPPRSATLSKWPIDDENPEKNVPTQEQLNKEPLEAGYYLQDLIYRAEIYSKHGKHETAVKLYRALAKAAPDRSTPFTKMCEEYEAAGDLPKATAACESALLRDGVLVKDYEHYVHLVLEASGPLNARQTKALAMVVQHMNQDPAGRAVVGEIECEIGVRTANASQLEECTAKLAATAPNDPTTVSYEWALAMVKGRMDEAARLLEQAKALGMKPEGLVRMQEALSEAQAGRHRWRTLFTVLAVTLLLAGGGVVVMTMKRRRVAAPQGA